MRSEKGEEHKGEYDISRINMGKTSESSRWVTGESENGRGIDLGC